MRTTLTLDDDVLQAARERSEREGRSIGAVVSDLARTALIGGAASPAAHRAATRNGFVPLPHRGGIVTGELVAELLHAEE